MIDLGYKSVLGESTLKRKLTLDAVASLLKITGSKWAVSKLSVLRNKSNVKNDQDRFQVTEQNHSFIKVILASQVIFDNRVDFLAILRKSLDRELF